MTPMRRLPLAYLEIERIDGTGLDPDQDLSLRRFGAGNRAEGK